MFVIRKSRRTMALAGAALALAGSATLTTAGSASAYGGTYCSAWWAASSSGSGHGWQMQVCINHANPGVVEGWVNTTSASNSTDVRIYWQLWCGSNVNDYNSTHEYSGTSHIPDVNSVDGGNSQCEMQAYMTESGNRVIPQGSLQWVSMTA